jgi:hypothetical protein
VLLLEPTQVVLAVLVQVQASQDRPSLEQQAEQVTQTLQLLQTQETVLAAETMLQGLAVQASSFLVMTLV